MAEEIIRMRDIRGAGLCSSGAREFFKAHDIEWSNFLKNGVPLSTIAAIDDYQAAKVVRFVQNGRRK